jgi:hypothetical protein
LSENLKHTPCSRLLSFRHGLATILLLLAGCSDCSRCSPTKTSTPELIRTLNPRYRDALTRARVWLDDLHVDPFELRSVGIKGKKKVTEQLDAYHRLWLVAPASEKTALLNRIREVVAITYEDRYHDMLITNDLWFTEDATSYLRTAVLMERLGLDTTRYREEIKKIHRRLNDHMGKRGPHQRRIFHAYYQQFGLTEPFDLANALEGGVISKRPDPKVMTNDDVYALTHEVYALYEYGDRLDIDPLDGVAKEYLQSAFETLMPRYIYKQDPDLTGELVECMHYLRLQDERTYLDGVKFILDAQNQDGSWGKYEQQRQYLGDYVRQGFQLHTTLVVIGALTAVFDRPMPGIHP